ncbi:MAG: triphosphoribosyl-dephospho-CoA synthase, partial [Candidatus Bathyarchaeia archaeon]
MFGSRIADDIARAAQLACILEVCTYPKPGNVTRFADFKDTKFEHFLAGSIAIGPVIWKAAKKGVNVALNKANLCELQVGRYILSCIVETRRWHRGGNINLGTVSLLVPIAFGAAISKAEDDIVDAKSLRKNIGKVVRSTTVKDAIYYYRAIKLLGFAGIGKVRDVPSLNVMNPAVERQIRNENVTLYQVMGECSSWDNICKEWRTEMNITFHVGYPTLLQYYSKTGDVNISIVHCFLNILANYPDTFIARKNGYQTAEKVSEKAKIILEKGGMLTRKGKEALEKFDLELRTEDNRLNPGTTADLTASSIMVA